MTDSKKFDLVMKNISVEFPGVKALDNAEFEMCRGEIQALIGANGAGKSTLMKVLSGVNSHYTGEVYLDNEIIKLDSPKAAKSYGIEIVYQEVDTALIPYFTVAENILLNSIVNSMSKKQFVNWKSINTKAKETLDRMNVDINVKKLAGELSLAEKQMVLIARAVCEECKYLILDEPTAPLSNTETNELFRIVRDLAQNHNVGVVFISHRINELFEICKDITIMKDGKTVGVREIDENLTQKTLVELMLGRKLNDMYNKIDIEIGDVLLEVKGLTEKQNTVKNIDLIVKKGEIVGLSGLVGAGKTELCKTLFGALKHTEGDIVLNGKKLQINSPNDAVKQGMALVPEERRKEGILVGASVVNNLSVAALSKFSNNFGFVSKKDEKTSALKLIKDIGIKTPSENQLVKYLSGGNQQKVAVGKWLVSEAEVYIFDEPTKGVDVGAKEDIFNLIEELAKQGKGVIYATCEFSEILGITDKSYVMYDGEIVKELETSKTSEEELLYYSTGGK
ncbi:MAG: sugar ABC transporter ATP-binding protein [Lachnospirales bacterium]